MIGLGAALHSLTQRRRPIWFGSLRSTAPVSSNWGSDRGLPVDRWYVERFLGDHRADITGRVLEVKDNGYTSRFGHDVTERAVLDIDPTNRRATIIADLTDGKGMPVDAFDCFVLTQTLQYVFDLPAAVATARRALSPGGVLLATVPVTSRVTEPPLTDYWRLTAAAMSRLLEDAFGRGTATVQGVGNVLSQVAFLEGLAADDLTEAELAANDERFPLLVCARAVRGR